MSLEPSSKTVKAGEVVRLNLEFDNNTGKDVSVFDFTLYYDTTRLEFLSVTPFIKNKLNDSYLGEIETSMNKDFLYVMYIDDFTSTSQSPITKDQKKILSLNFRARPDAPMGDATFEPKSPTATDFEMENNFPIKFEATKISVVGDPTTTPPPTTVKTDASGNTVTAITTARQGTSAKTTKFVMKTTKGEITIIPVTTEEQTTTEKTSAPTFTNGNPGDDDDSDVAMTMILPCGLSSLQFWCLWREPAALSL